MALVIYMRWNILMIFLAGFLVACSGGTGNVVFTGEETGNALGNENASLTIVEYSDYECPFCSRFYRETFPQLKEDYIDTGKVYYVHRNFPLTQIHANAQKSAEAAVCAEQQGAFWEMTDNLSVQRVQGGPAKYKQYAGELGLDMEAFSDCLDSGRAGERVRQEAQQGVAQGVRSTPSFVIDGEVISGAQPYDVFKQLLDSKLG